MMRVMASMPIWMTMEKAFPSGLVILTILLRIKAPVKKIISITTTITITITTTIKITMTITMTMTMTIKVTKNYSRFIIWWVTLAGAIVICMYGVEESDMLVRELDGVSPSSS